MRLVFAAGLATLVLTAGFGIEQALSHHPTEAVFDQSTRVTLAGVIVQSHWSNPHAGFALEVLQADGTVALWMVETASPSSLLRRGLDRESFKIGERVSIDAFVARDRSQRALLRYLRWDDGREMDFPESRWVIDTQVPA